HGERRQGGRAPVPFLPRSDDDRDGDLEGKDDLTREGVTCSFCHSIVSAEKEWGRASGEGWRRPRAAGGASIGPPVPRRAGPSPPSREATPDRGRSARCENPPWPGPHGRRS